MRISVFIGLASLLAASNAGAAAVDVYLRADAYSIPANAFGNKAPIYMWGLVTTDASFVSAPTGVASVPGPTLTAAAGSTLNIHLKNNLPSQPADFSEPISLVIPGQTPVLAPGTWPVWDHGSPGNRTDPTQRVRSFTVETAPRGGVTVYTFSNLKPGTYLYQSGTHPSVQMQMGLYGVLKVSATTAGLAYDDASTAFDSDVALVFSEIDPVLHAAIAANHYGPTPTPPAPADWMTSTIGYRPQYFLINGAPYQATASPIPAGAAGKKLLVRLLNAGLENKVPVLQGPYLSIIAEDANLITVTNAAGAIVPAPRSQYSVLLPAGMTIDAIVATPAKPSKMAVYDRRMSLTNGGAATPGGMLTYLQTH